MGTEFAAVFETLKGVLSRHADGLAVQSDTATDYSLGGTVPSPFPQHKSGPMWFGAVRMGKAYVSFHLMPLYMDELLQSAVPADLKTRMQGKTCFKFKKVPEPELLGELDELTAAALRNWKAKRWL